jgi:hypothetical protein
VRTDSSRPPRSQLVRIVILFAASRAEMTIA